MVAAPRVLVILDGASEPLGPAPTSLERAATPALDALCAQGTLSRVRTVAPWLEAGSDSAIPALLGWVPPAPVDRGLVEAAAREIDVPAGCHAWRIDVRERDGAARADAAAVRERLAAALSAATASARAASRTSAAAAPARAASRTPPAAAPARAAAPAAAAPAPHVVHALGGHRLLVVGPGPLPPLPELPGVALRAWPAGIVPAAALDAATVVVAAPGAAAGIGRLMGARVVTPPGATGRPGSDLAGKARAAVSALEGGAERVVVHVGGPDEAAHEHDAAAKVAAIEAADRTLVAALAAAVWAAGGTLCVCPDHGCDPATGRHDAALVPCVTWSPAAAAAAAARRPAHGAPPAAEGAPGPQRGTPRRDRRLTERAVAGLTVTELERRAQVAT